MTAAILEAIYTSLANENEGLDEHIQSLKTSLAKEGKASVRMEKARLAVNNRQGRKLLQSYFKKRGVVVDFGE